MATYLELRTRIITELARDDLEDDLATTLVKHCERACEYYADRKFWFNSVITTATTSANTATVTIPSGVRVIERVTVPAYDVELREVTLTGLGDDTVYALPDRYSYYNDTIRFYPIPDQAYTLNIYSISQVDAPSDDGDTNIWTTEAEDLIVGHVKATLARSVFRDPEGYQLFAGERQDALARLRRETAKRLETPLRPYQRHKRYNINYG